ncbi:uncharacterized protein LOC130738229 [Lotus japonicus]|uniref:uncharacterized protein LOC130738229 n=1 Tax=Lotus japonicus TaxID=34305 RepID=UPI00258704D6|nr:uncharacterized protein LOC130738229 [Lotus japonicus]
MDVCYVSDLIDAGSHSWDMTVLSTVFPPMVVELIASISFPLFPIEDDVFWPDTEDGFYSAKSGYCFIRNQENRLAASSSTSHEVSAGFWKQFWQLETQPRVKELMWRLCRGVAPVRANLSSRGLDIDTLYPLCGLEPESLVHAFFTCCHVAPFWFASSLSCRFDDLLPHQPTEFSHVLHQLFEVVDDEALKVLFITRKGNHSADFVSKLTYDYSDVDWV